MKVLITEPDFYNDKLLNQCPREWQITKLNIVSNKVFTQQLKKEKFGIIFVKIGLSMNKLIIDTQPNLKLIITPTTGLDHIDVEYAEIKKIKIISLKNDIKFLSSITSTAEHAWMLALALQRKLLDAINIVKGGRWERESLSIYQFKDKTIGIIGYGRLGKIISMYGKAFKMDVIANDIKKNIKNAGVKLVSLENLIINSDVIIIVASYQNGQPPIISHKEISFATKRPIIVNVSRGGVVNEEAILTALENKLIDGYACDVVSDDSNWDNEKKISNKLIEKFKKDKRIIITPHIGGFSIDAIKSTREYVLKKAINYKLKLF